MQINFMREGVKSKQIIIANNKVFIVAMVNNFIPTQKKNLKLEEEKKLRSEKVYKVGSIIRSKEIRGKKRDKRQNN